MARGVRTLGDTALGIVDMAVESPDSSLRNISRTLSVPLDTVRRTLSRYEPVTSELRHIKTDWLTGMWQSVAAGALAKLHAAAFNEENAPSNRELIAWNAIAGTATDKVLILSGRPTQVTASITEVRVSLHDVASRLSGVARRLTTSSSPAIIEAETVVQPSEKTGEGR